MQNNYNDLCTRIENDILIGKRPKEQIISEIPSDLLRSNFIINEAYCNYEQAEYAYMQLSDISFKVLLIEKNGLIHDNYNQVVIQRRCIDLIFTKSTNLKIVKKNCIWLYF